MAIDMIENNELSALANQRSGFKNDLQRMPKRKRPITLDSDFSNFSIGGVSFLEKGATIIPTYQSKGDEKEQAVYDKYGKPEVDFSVSGMEEKGDCQGVELMITKVQQRLDLIASERGQSSNKKQSNAYNNVYNNTQSYKNDLDNLYKRMGCKVKKEQAELEKTKKENIDAIISSTTASQIGLNQAEALSTTKKAGASMNTIYIIGGVVILGVVGFVIFRRK
jgi:LPXTG-motif cell wall-anchored protein